MTNSYACYILYKLDFSFLWSRFSIGYMQKQSLKQIAYNIIKNKIITCEYKPNSFLNEDALCIELSMSRTPVRDALSRIEQEHLIKIYDKKGFLIMPISISEIEMVFEGRLLLESYIIVEYCSNLQEDDIAYLKNINNEIRKSISLNDEKYYIHDNEFHQALISRCKNKYLLRAYDDIYNQNSRLRYLSGKHNKIRLEETYKEHNNIIKALKVNNTKLASEMMKIHLTESKISYYKVISHDNTLI